MSLESTLAGHLAASIAATFPQAQIVGWGKGGGGFYCDALFPFEFQELFLKQVEEDLRCRLKRREETPVREMVPKSAAALLESCGQKLRADAVRRSEAELVRMVQIGAYHDLCPEGWVEDLSGAHLKLTAFAVIGRAVRIFGVGGWDRSELKGKGRLRHHLERLEERGWILPNGVWTPKGERVREKLIAAAYQEGFSPIATPPLRDVKEGVAMIAPLAGKKFVHCPYVFGGVEETVREGLFHPSGYHIDLGYIRCSGRDLTENCISSLQSMIKILKMLPFEFQCSLKVGGMGTQEEIHTWKQGIASLQSALDACGLKASAEAGRRRQSGPQIELRFPDIWGRTWPGPFLSCEANFVLVRSVFGPLERLMALLIEADWKGGETE